jgi:hypothetical protein
MLQAAAAMPHASFDDVLAAHRELEDPRLLERYCRYAASRCQ